MSPPNWTSAEVRRWLENEGFHEFWPFIEAYAPITGQDLFSLTSDDWYRLFDEKPNGLRRPSAIKVRRLCVALTKFRSNSYGSVQHSKFDENSTIPRSTSLDSDDVFGDDFDKPPCHVCNASKQKRYSTSIRPERWKTLLAFLYSLVVSWVTAFVMVIVHDRVPDMEKYPPLPDIILDNIPHIPWAFDMCEVTGVVLLTVWFVVVLFHKHRFILMRRFFSISGTIFMLRCVTMLITSLSVPGTHLKCTPRPYGDIWRKLYNAYIIWTGGGMSLQGVRSCGDYMFSGHTVSLTLLNFFITEYTSPRIYFLHTFTWICNVFGVFFILAAHEHYSIDVFVAFYITSRLFMYYHVLASQTTKARPAVSYEVQRAWFWFPLFTFFESEIDGNIPNEFAWPLTMYEVAAAFDKAKAAFKRPPAEGPEGDKQRRRSKRKLY